LQKTKDLRGDIKPIDNIEGKIEAQSNPAVHPLEDINAT
jgi:hypothetical protein